LKAKLVAMFILIYLLLYSICFAKTPQFEHLFSDRGSHYYYDSNNTYWSIDNTELYTIIRVRLRNGVTVTEMDKIKGSEYFLVGFQSS
jgi:hypothetical protein